MTRTSLAAPAPSAWAQMPLHRKAIVSALVTLAVVVSSIIGAQALGASFMDCGWQCRDARQTPGSSWMSAAAVIGSFALAVFLFMPGHEKTFLSLAIVAGLAGLVAFGISRSIGAFCPLCLALQLTWVSIALLAPRHWLPFTLGVPTTVLSLWASWWVLSDEFGHKTGPTTYVSRGYEPFLRGTPAAMVIFTDPFCPACRTAATKLDTSRVGVPVLYRWLLLSKHSQLSLKACIVVEDAMTKDLSKGLRLRELLLKSSEEPSLGLILDLCEQAGLSREDCGRLAQNPPAHLLALIAQDAKDARAAGINSTPTVCYVNTILVDGGPPKMAKMTQHTYEIFSEVTDLSGLEAYYPTEWRTKDRSGSNRAQRAQGNDIVD